MTETRKWYAVYTKPKWEKKVSELLTRKEIINYCPLNRVQRQWADRRKIIYEPLFKSYVFVYVNSSDHIALKSTDGVINMVHWIGKPAVIRDEEIETIRKFLDEYKSVELEKTKVKLEDKVRIIAGPLMMKEGTIVGISSKKVRVHLPSLGYAMIAEVANSNIKPIEFLSSTGTGPF